MDEEADGHSNYPVVFLFLKVQATLSRKTTRAEHEEGQALHLEDEVLDVNFSHFPFFNFLFIIFIFQLKPFSKCSPLPQGCWKWLRCAQGWQGMAVTGQWQMLPIASACPGWAASPQGREPFLEQVRTTLAPWQVQGALASASRSCILEPHCPGPQIAPGQEDWQIVSRSFTVFPERRSLIGEAPYAQVWWAKVFCFAWILDKNMACFFIKAPPPTATFILW